VALVAAFLLASLLLLLMRTNSENGNNPTINFLLFLGGASSFSPSSHNYYYRQRKTTTGGKRRSPLSLSSRTNVFRIDDGQTTATTTAFRRSWAGPLSQRRPTTTATATSSLIPTARTSTTTALGMSIGWEELVYNAESAANQLATSGLRDPNNLIRSVPIMYGAGLLTSVSPCVWGLLPLTMSYISTAAGERKDGKVLLPTFAFAAGLAAVFCSLGVAAAQLGGVFGSNSNNAGSGNPATSLLLPLLSYGVCFLMGFQLLDLITVPIPKFGVLDVTTTRRINTGAGGANPNASDEPQLIFIDEDGAKLSSRTDREREEDEDEGGGQGGSLLRTFLLGGSSALVASPCATPVLTSILAFVASSRNPVMGAAFLLVYTLGYSTPLLVVASTGGQALVKLRQAGGGGDGTSIYGKIAPWVTPLTAGVLLWYGTNGMLTALFGDPSLAALAPVIE